jgi:serine/threonine-protein kinase
MGSVWLGRRASSADILAVKVMLPSVAADRRSVMRFLQEINVTRALRHRNVVRLIETGYHHGIFYLALEYCDNGSVAALINERNSPLSVDESIDITTQVLDGLEYAHCMFGKGKPLIHRDLKPENLFLAGSGSNRVAKIGDFGLAKALDDTGLSGLTRTGETAGTPYFMPRQQVLQFKRPSPEFDVWAVAASFYFMLTRFPPRSFTNETDQWITVLETDPIPVRKRRPDVPRRVAEVIDQALTEKPTIGIKSATELKNAILAAR